jgi:glutamyl-tRNA reductase
MSEIVCVTVSHATAAVAGRERLAVPARSQGAAAAAAVRSGIAREALVLSTCDRVDTYVVAADGDSAEAALLEQLARRAGMAPAALAARAKGLRGSAAVRHLLRTAAGLESPVLGDADILGQVRRAHEGAKEASATGPVLDRLVAHALRAGRRARSETALATGSVSLRSVATGLARTLVGDATGGRALVVGATGTARGLTRRLVADGWAVTSFLELGDGPSLAPLLDAFDVVACATGTPLPLLPVEAVVDAAEARHGRPLLVLDLSVPRDVDAAARELDGVLLYDVDDLGAAAEHAIAGRRAAIPGAEVIVSEELDDFEGWLANRSPVPTIKALHEHVRRTVLEGLGDAVDGDAALATALERVVTRLLQAPTQRLRAAAASGAGDRYAELVRELFGLREDAPAAGRPASVSHPPARDTGSGSVTV